MRTKQIKLIYVSYSGQKSLLALWWVGIWESFYKIGMGVPLANDRLSEE